MRQYFSLLLFFLLGILFYSPILFAGFAADDYYQLVKPSYFHSLQAVIAVYGEVLASPSGHSTLTGFFYRPFTYMIYSLIYFFSHGRPLYFHIVQLALYLGIVYLLFIFFTTFLSQKLSLLLAFIFFIHPANNELAAYIAALSDTLCVFFGILALVIIAKAKNNSLGSTCTVALCFLLALLSKETGIVFVALASFYVLLKKRQRNYLIASSTIVAAYLICRIHASYHQIGIFNASPILHFSLLQRIYVGIEIAGAIIKEVIIPTRMSLLRGSFQPSFSATIYAAIVVVILIMCYGSTYLWFNRIKKPTSMLLFFGIWILFGIIFFVQILPLEVLFAERWLSIAEIGILGFFGLVLQGLPHLQKNKWYYTCITLGICVLLLYALYTFILNFYWLDWHHHIAL